MKRILFLFNSNGDIFQIIEDADNVNHCSKDYIILGYDGTTICKINNGDISDYKFLTLSDNEEIDLNNFKNKKDVEYYSFLQWEKAIKTEKVEKITKIQNDLQFYESRHKKLLELIEYTEREIEKAPYFSGKWEKLQRKVITLENQLRQVDSKREKAYAIMCDLRRE